MTDLLDLLQQFRGFFISCVVIVSGLWALRAWMHKHKLKNQDAHLFRQLVSLVAWILGLLVLLLSLPVSDTTRGQILSLIGVVTTALIALSSTTFVANTMAGLLLRIVGGFKPGDFIHVGDYFGRVTERGLFHTEIQTEDRDLMTLPNMHLVNNPVTVVFSSGTIVTANISLGYEIHHSRIEQCLIQAAEKAGLKDPFVQVRELGDFSVSYRVAGRLEDVASLLTARSELRKQMLDALHGADIEIVSPGFVYQRREDADKPKIAKPPARKSPRRQQRKAEELVFDKAEEASKKEQKKEAYLALQKELAELGADKSGDNAARISQIESQIEQMDADRAAEEAAEDKADTQHKNPS